MHNAKNALLHLIPKIKKICNSQDLIIHCLVLNHLYSFGRTSQISFGRTIQACPKADTQGIKTGRLMPAF
jgi:hypothetical protein